MERYKEANFWRFILILVILTFIVSCAVPSATITPAVNTVPATTGPKYGGTLRIGVPQGPMALDPVIVGSDTGCKVLVGAYTEGLTTGIGRNISDLKLVGKLAKSWEISKDGLTYTFKLQEGV